MLDDLLLIPTLLFPGQTSEEFDRELDEQLARTLAVRDLLSGNIGLEDYCDLLNDQKYYPDQLLDHLDHHLG